MWVAFVNLVTALLLIASPALSQYSKNTVKVIFDTDMGPDYDDVGAITLLHAYADSGYAEILATIASSRYQNVGAVLDVLNTYFNRPDIPIAVPKQGVDLRDWQRWSDTLVSKYPHSVQSNADTEDPVSLYRKLLSAQEDRSVTIITVGFLTNIAALLQSGADSHSTLKGVDLVRKKVRQLVSMAGRFPSGKEFNIEIDSTAGQYALMNWPVRLVLSGFEIGMKIKTGLPLISDTSIQASPVKDVFRISIPMDKSDSAGRMSWDQTAVLVGVRGNEPYYSLVPGSIVVARDGSNTWKKGKRKQYHLVEKRSPAQVQQVINRLMMHQPVTGKVTRGDNRR